MTGPDTKHEISRLMREACDINYDFSVRLDCVPNAPSRSKFAAVGWLRNGHSVVVGTQDGNTPDAAILKVLRIALKGKGAAILPRGGTR